MLPGRLVRQNSQFKINNYLNDDNNIQIQDDQKLEDENLMKE